MTLCYLEGERPDATSVRAQTKLWPLVDRAFQRESRTICLHTGATAVPGSLTKGDLDLLVRVDRERFGEDVDLLGDHCSIDQRHNGGETYASFIQPRADDPAVGIQLVVRDSADDRAFIDLRRLLRSRADLVTEANTLKRSFEGGDPKAYRTAKHALYERFLLESG